MEKYRYLYETHLHTNRASGCARNTGTEMAEAAIRHGYSGIIVTEHNWYGNSCVPKDLPWEQWVDHFTWGYREALAYGQEHDLDVFWGYESNYDGTEFLIYGLTPEWLKEHPQIKTATVEEQYRMVKAAGGFVVHAHPFRAEWYIPEIRLFPEYVDAVEGINATHSNSHSLGHNDPQFDVQAIAYAREHHLPMTAGSDIHKVDMYGGGILFPRRVRSMQDFIELFRTGDYLLTNGEILYDKDGNPLGPDTRQ